MYAGGTFYTFLKGLLELLKLMKIAKVFECKMRDESENHVSISWISCTVDLCINRVLIIDALYSLE